MTKRSNKQVVIGRSSLHYKETHRQFTMFIAHCADDVKQGAAHVEFLERGTTTKLRIRERKPGEPCKDAEEAYLWLLELSSNLTMGRNCGKLDLTPKGETTEICVEK